MFITSLFILFASGNQKKTYTITNMIMKTINSDTAIVLRVAKSLSNDN